jgi:hypothetical protein
VITLRTEPGTDGPRAVRALLKLALRAFGLRCIRVNQIPGVGNEL